LLFQDAEVQCVAMIVCHLYSDRQIC